MGDRCTGHCCRAFNLPYAPNELLDGAQRFGDGEYIADMVIYLGLCDALPDRKPALDSTGQVAMAHFYTCRHLDEDTGNCTAYETRPKLCSEYPYGKRCEYSACTWDEARNAPDVTLGHLKQSAMLIAAKSWMPSGVVERDSEAKAATAEP